MIRKFSYTVVMFAFAGLTLSGFLLTGCKKNQPSQPTQAAPSTSAKPSVSAVQPEVLQNRKGLDLMKTGNYDQAVREFTQAIEKYPDFELSYSNRAAALIMQNKYSEAEADLKKAAEINPKNPLVHYNFASLYALQKKTGQSLASLDQALDLGFRDYGYLLKDPDLDNIRKSKEFRQILKKHKVALSQ